MVENQNGVFRPRRNNFAQVSNSALQDSDLSLKAKGLYAVIESYIGKPNFKLYKRTLKQLCKEGTKAFDTTWKELKDTGYLKVYRMPSGKNDCFQYEYELLFEADTSTPALINLNKKGEVIPQKNPESDSESADNPHTPQKGVYANSEDTEPEIPHTPQNGGNANSEEDSHTPHFVPYANGSICEGQYMPNGGDIRNTDQRNTYLRNIKSINQSEDDRLTDSIRERMKKQIEFDYFEDNYPNDIGGITTVLECMVDMLSRPTTKIDGVVQSRDTIERYLSQVDACYAREFLDDMKKKNLAGIKNPIAYWKTSLINFIRAQELLQSQA